MGAPVPDKVAAWHPRRVHLDGAALALPFTFDLPERVKSVTVKCRAVGGPGASATVDDGVNATPLFVGDEETWTAGEDEQLVGPLSVSLTVAGDVVTVYWTERP